jgi:hypothetical protein
MHMREGLRAKVREAISTMRGGQRDSVGDHPLWVVARVLTQTVNARPESHSGLTLGEASRAAQEAIEGLFDDGDGVSLEELSEWITGASAVIRDSSSRPIPSEGVSGMEVGCHLLVLSVLKLLELQRLDPEAAATLCMVANGMDDELFKRLRDDYGLRPAILGELVRCFERMPGRVRHADLAARLKWGLAAAELDEAGLFNVGLRALRELPEEIARRIQETHDGRGMGRRPNGQPVEPLLAVGHPRRAAGLSIMQGYRSLPRLRAESLFELGRLLAHARLGVLDRNLTEAHHRFDEASVAFLAAGEPTTAAMAAIAATDCLARRLPLTLDGHGLGRLRQELLAHGVATERQVLGSGLPSGTARPLALLARATCAPARAIQSVEALLRGLHSGAPTSEHTEEVQRLREECTREAAMHFQVLRETASTEPWRALCSGSAAILLHTTFWTALHTLRSLGIEDIQRRQLRESIQDGLRRHTPPEVFPAFITAIASAGARLREPSRGAQSPWAPGLRHDPLASPSRLFEAIGSLLHLLAESGQPLPAAHWLTLAEVLEWVRIPSVELSRILEFEAAETRALRYTLRHERPGGTWHEYLRLRIRAIESAMVAAMLTASERALLSGWLTRLLTLFRDFDDGLRTLAPEEALWLLERTGASSFRASTLWFGRGESGVLPRYMPRSWSDVTEAFQAPLAADDDAEHSLAMWHELLLSRDWLDQYGRLKMSIEAGHLNPAVQAAFSELRTDPARTWMAFPRETSPAYIQELTGVPPESWEETDSAIVVRFTPGSYAQVCDQVDRARRGIATAFSRLCARGEIADGEPMPDVDPEALRALFVNRPGLALLVPGPWPEAHTPIALFTSRRGAIVRLEAEVLEETGARSRGDAALLALRETIRQDRKETSVRSFELLGEAMRTLREALAPWSRRLADLLAREGISELLILLRGIDFALMPWEELDADESGGRLGDRVVMGHLHSLARLPSLRTSTRQGTVQIHGDGASAPIMNVGASRMHALASAGVARAPLSGTQACDARKLQDELRTAARLRLFLHGFHHGVRPEADRITLVDGESIHQRVDLKVDGIHALAVAGMESVELWACEGGAYGRHLMEHGVAEEPEDLTIAFLQAGARRVISSRWHVPVLPSALLMERFALLLEATHHEARALARARSELRAAFAPGGFIEQRVTALASPGPGARLDEAGASDKAVPLQEMEHSLARAVDALRYSWYAERGISPSPLPIGPDGVSLERLVRFVPPRSKRGAEAQAAPVPTLAERIQDALGPFRDSTCWAGWRLTLRTLEDWRA